MKQAKATMLMFMVAFISFLVVGICPEARSDSIKFRLAHGRPKTHITGRTVEKFKEFVEKASNGQLQIDVYPDAQLYNDRTAPGAIAGNYIELACTSNVVLTGWVPGWDILSMPFMFKSDEQFYEFTSTDAWKKLLRDTEAKGVKVISFWPGGSVFHWNRVRPIKSINDFSGIKTRVLESKIHKDIINTLGANAMPVSFPEVYTALQQGMVDGVFTTVDAMYTAKWYEYVDYGLTNPVIMVGTGIMVSQNAWKSLPPDLQKLLMEQGRKASDWENIELAQDKAKKFEAVQKGGVALNTLSPEGLEKVKTAIEPVVNRYKDKVGQDLISAAQKMN